MAKLKGPLFSLGASQQLGKALVYFPWKGINAVRTYVIPTNPKSADQQTQRAFMTAAVAEWHGALYSASDRIAWNRYAGVLADIMSGFNAMIRTHVKEGILTNAWQRIKAVTSANPHETDFEVECNCPAPGADPTVHMGTSKTFMPTTTVLDNLGAGNWGKTIGSLVGDTLYYFYIVHGASGTDYGRTGIYQQKTEPA